MGSLNKKPALLVLVRKRRVPNFKGFDHFIGELIIWAQSSMIFPLIIGSFQ